MALVSISSLSFKITYWLRHYLNFIFFCQSCDVIFPPKTVKIEKQKTYDCLEYKVLYHPENVLTLLLAQADKNCKSGS